MNYHVPFEHRNGPQPIFIGFDELPRRRRWNWWAFFGFPLSLLGILTAGILSPLALLLNAIAMRRRPRRLAAAGLFLSLVGTTILLGIIGVGVHHFKREHERRAERAKAREVKVKVEETRLALNSLSREFESFREAHRGRLPNWIDANMMALSHEDAWGTPLRFDAERDHSLLRSAGPDQRFDTDDDVFLKIEGTSPRTLDPPLQ